MDRDKLLARKRRYSERHRDQISQNNRMWREKNKEYLSLKNKEWRDAHPDYGVANTKRWRMENPELFAAQKRADACNWRAKQMNVIGHISRSDITVLWERQPVCVGCGNGRGVDHVIEFWQGGANTPDNLQNLCCQCNVEKTARLRFPRAA